MLRQWLEFLSPADLSLIHETSMALMNKVGLQFHSEEAIAVFQKHGLKVDGQTVYFDESLVLDAIATTPATFIIHARNPANDVEIGSGGPKFAPGLGAPFIIDPVAGRRKPTMEDYKNLVRLAHELPNQDLTGYMLVQPGDVPDCAVHLNMTLAGMVHSDKPFLGSSEGKENARHALEMAAILFDETPASLADRPVTMAPVNSLSPLQYNDDMAGALMEYARWRQPVMITALIMAGATGPITLAGVLAQQNAEILAGLTLAQLINLGTPVLYGTTSTIMDMRTGSLAIGSPELSLVGAGTAQLARRYGLPCRGGGALTDAHGPDAQAGSESTLNMVTTINSGFDFVLHAAGILSSYLAFSYEKFVIDDELCGMVRRYRQGITVNPETLAFDVIANVGPGGNFLKERHTVSRCRHEFWQPALNSRGELEAWLADGRPDVASLARRRWQSLLAQHEDPPLDSATVGRLQAYIEEHAC